MEYTRQGYLPEAMVNFLALLGWNPGDKREIMSIEQLISCFDLSRLTKANSLFDRHKLIAFNTEHIKLAGKEKLLSHFKDYLKAIKSPVANADDKTLARIIELCAGARTLSDIERKSRFLFLDNDKIEYEDKAKKVLLKGDGVNVLQTIRSKIETQALITAQYAEIMLRSLAEEKKVGLGEVAQPLRVAICGSTISLPIFDSVEMLGKENTLARIDKTVEIIQGKAVI
jgi:glutamyl-tRNA synthetase